MSPREVVVVKFTPEQARLRAKAFIDSLALSRYQGRIELIVKDGTVTDILFRDGVKIEDCPDIPVVIPGRV